jgi:hypothetical protein
MRKHQPSAAYARALASAATWFQLTPDAAPAPPMAYATPDPTVKDTVVIVSIRIVIDILPILRSDACALRWPLKTPCRRFTSAQWRIDATQCA